MSLLFSEYVKENWSIHKLPEIVWFQEGPGVRKHQYRNAGVKLLNVANLQEGKVDLTTSDRYISEKEAYGKYKHFLVDDGDLIIASSGIKVEYFEKKMGFVNSEHLPLCMNTSTIRFKSKNDKHLHIRYLMHYLKTNYFKLQIGRLITGSAQLNFGPSHLKKIQIPLPPLSEQKRIVAILDKAQQLIDLRKQQLTKLDELIQSIFYEMFGDPVTNPKGWEKERFGTVFTISSGGTPSKSKPEYWENGTIPWIGSNICKNKLVYSNDGKFITELGLKKSSAKIFPENTILVALVGATIGKTALLKFETTTNQNIAGIIVDDLNSYNPFFIFYYLQALYYEFMNIGEEKFKMANLTFVRNLEIGHAPISLQNQFAAKVEKIEEQKKVMQQSLTKLEENFKALQQRAFRGHL